MCGLGAFTVPLIVIQGVASVPFFAFQSVVSAVFFLRRVTPTGAFDEAEGRKWL